MVKFKDKLFICGTNGYSPACSWRNVRHDVVVLCYWNSQGEHDYLNSFLLSFHCAFSPFNCPFCPSFSSPFSLFLSPLQFPVLFSSLSFVPSPALSLVLLSLPLCGLSTLAIPFLSSSSLSSFPSHLGWGWGIKERDNFAWKCHAPSPRPQNLLNFKRPLWQIKI